MSENLPDFNDCRHNKSPVKFGNPIFWVEFKEVSGVPFLTSGMLKNYFFIAFLTLKMMSAERTCIL
jgi:hypothetical protein